MNDLQDRGALSGQRIAVIGLGDVGGTLAAQLVDAGAGVVGMRRGASAPAGVQLLRGDASSPQDLARLPRDTRLLVCVLTPDGRDEAAYRQTYLEGARALARHARGADALERILFVSSTSVYGQDDGSRVDESSPTVPASFRGQVLLQAEAALRESGVPVTALRSAGIYGPGRSMLIRRVLRGEGVAAGGPPAWGNRIHRDDLVGALLHLLGLAAAGRPLDETLIAVDDAPAPLAEVLDWLAERLGVGLTERIEVPDRGGNKRLDNRRLKATGYRLQFPDYRAGYGALLDAMAASGELDALRAGISSGP